MTLEELLDTWDIDSTLDKEEPGGDLLNITKLHAKYMRILVKHKLILKKCKDDLATERKIRYNYYSGNYNIDKTMLAQLGLEPFKFILKNEINTYIETDKAIITINDKIAYHQEMINVCESIMATFKNRTFEIRGYIDWLRFKNGA